MKRLLILFLVACGGVGTTDIDAGLDASGDQNASDQNTGDQGAGDAGTCTKVTPGSGGCAVGECLCGQQQGCYAAAEAVSCCGGSVTCATNGGGSEDAGGCTFKHPLVDGSARFCAAGDCYCKWNAGESCYPAALAAGCCVSDSLTCY